VVELTHPIPDDALDSDIAILGRKGGGKTFTAKGIVERLLDLGRRVLILDPLGVWAGLRTSADGEKPGYKVAIFGGLHADMPLDPAAAEPLARIIATENLPAVIDLSELSKTAQQAFLLKFLHDLRRVNTEALTIVLEEADVFAPQQPMGDDSKALHGEIDWIARRGRFKGFRLISITQRPARLSKDVLTQAATLVAHRLPSPQDREAVKAWVDGNGDRDLAKQVFDTLATLAVGEAWLYAPEQNILARAKFPQITTLDTSATPKAGEKRIEPKTLAQVDVSHVEAALLSSPPSSEGTKAKLTRPGASELAAAEDRGYRRGLEEGRSQGVMAGFGEGIRLASAAIDSVATDENAKAFRDRGVPVNVVKFDPAETPTPHPSLVHSQPAFAKMKPATQKAINSLAEAAVEHTRSSEGLAGPLQKIVDAIAWWNAAGIAAPTQRQVSFMAGYSFGGTWDKYRSTLRTGGYIDVAAGSIALTAKGRDVARPSGSPASNEALHAAVRSRIDGPLCRFLDVLIGYYPEAISTDRWAELAGYGPGGTADKYRSSVRSLDLAETPERGKARAAAWLFPFKVEG